MKIRTQLKTDNKRIYPKLFGIPNMHQTDSQIRVDMELICNFKCILDITGFTVSQEITFNYIYSNSCTDRFGIFNGKIIINYNLKNYIVILAKKLRYIRPILSF